MNKIILALDTTNLNEAISLTKKIVYLILIIFCILGLFVFGNYEINKNKKKLMEVNDELIIH